MTSRRRPAGDVPAGRSPAHGSCDDEQTRRLLRSRPPRQALAWAAGYLGGPVVPARALRGGMSSAVHLLTVQDDGRQRRQAVLPCYMRPELNEQEPEPPGAGHGRFASPGGPACPPSHCWPPSPQVNALPGCAGLTGSSLVNLLL